MPCCCCCFCCCVCREDLAFSLSLAAYPTAQPPRIWLGSWGRILGPVASATAVQGAVGIGSVLRGPALWNQLAGSGLSVCCRLLAAEERTRCCVGRHCRTGPHAICSRALCWRALPCQIAAAGNNPVCEVAPPFGFQNCQRFKTCRACVAGPASRQGDKWRPLVRRGTWGSRASQSGPSARQGLAASSAFEWGRKQGLTIRNRGPSLFFFFLSSPPRLGFSLPGANSTWVGI